MSQGQEAVSDREARLCRRIERYAERRARETPQEKRERLSNRRERDARRRSRLTAIYMFCLACTSLFRNMKLNAIAQSGSPPNVLHLPSVSLMPIGSETDTINHLPASICLSGVAIREAYTLCIMLSRQITYVYVPSSNLHVMATGSASDKPTFSVNFNVYWSLI